MLFAVQAYTIHQVVLALYAAMASGEDVQMDPRIMASLIRYLQLTGDLLTTVCNLAASQEVPRVLGQHWQ